MKPSYLHRSLSKTSCPGFSLIEMMVAVAASVVLITAVVLLTIFTSRTFYMTGNYVDMDSKSRNAIDIMSREIRNSSALLAYGTSNPAYLLFTNATAGTATTITYDSTARTLSMAKTGQATRIYLTGCDQWNFSLYNRVPNITSANVSFYSATNLAQVKLVNLSWTCSRKVMGSKLNTETVLTAQIVLRNKVK